MSHSATHTNFIAMPFGSKRLASSHVWPPAKTVGTGIGTAGCMWRSKATIVCTHANHPLVMFSKKQLKQLLENVNKTKNVFEKLANNCSCIIYKYL